MTRVEFTYELSPQLWAQAEMERRAAVGPRLQRVTLALILATCASILILTGAIALGLIFAVLALILAMKRTTVAMLRRGVTAVFKQNPSLTSLHSCVLDEDGVHIQSATESSSRPWSTFVAWWDTSVGAALGLSPHPNGASLLIPYPSAEIASDTRLLLAIQLGPSQTAGIQRNWRRTVTRTCPASVVLLVGAALLLRLAVLN